MGALGLRVAQVIVSDAFAGTERYATNLAAGLSLAGADVFLVGGDPGQIRAALTERGEGVTPLPAATLAAAWSQLRRLGRVDVVHAHLTSAEVAATLAFPGRSRSAIVCTRHIAARRGASLLGRAAAPILRARLDGQLAPSKYVADRVDGASLVVPTGVADAELGLHDEQVVLVVQRLEPEKDTETALRAWAASGLAKKGWELHIAGTGSQEPALRDVARQAGVAGSCRFLGQVHSVAERLSRGGLMLATATGDSFGLSVVEAMACGLPVVAAAAGGHLETVGPVEDAALFQAQDHLGAAALMRRLAEDQAARAAYGTRLRERQRAEYSLGGFVERVASWYKRVLGERGAGSHLLETPPREVSLP
jgi:glycosyltransferase involved in cell wall biosynthesis